MKHIHNVSTQQQQPNTITNHETHTKTNHTYNTTHGTHTTKHNEGKNKKDTSHIMTTQKMKHLQTLLFKKAHTWKTQTKSKMPHIDTDI